MLTSSCASGEEVGFDQLSTVGRRLKGKAQGINSGADIFLASAEGTYVGRVCDYRECHPRVACQAQHCGRLQHLNDDLHVVTLSEALIAEPPLILYPQIVRSCVIPPDVDEQLVALLQVET